MPLLSPMDSQWSKILPWVILFRIRISSTRSVLCRTKRSRKSRISSTSFIVETMIAGSFRLPHELSEATLSKSGTMPTTPTMTAYSFGDVLLVPFHFTDQTGNNKRPAVVVSSAAYHRERTDLILMAVTSQIRPPTDSGDIWSRMGRRVGAAQALAPEAGSLHRGAAARPAKVGTVGRGPQAVSPAKPGENPGHRGLEDPVPLRLCFSLPPNGSRRLTPPKAVPPARQPMAPHHRRRAGRDDLPVLDPMRAGPGGDLRQGGAWRKRRRSLLPDGPREMIPDIAVLGD